MRKIPEGPIVWQNCSAPNQERCNSYFTAEIRKEKEMEGRRISEREENQGSTARPCPMTHHISES